ncbi:L-aspartate oxidase [Pontibacillus yanchengensis]|uniref:L-aspartate oxidase n=3 Tax=Pontibacillus yanchengensis TaxID=462910 RepID=A0ACC7VKD7_9BACI|nr:L-aspartate oxidase [Pontibacillus yanchengensis]MYL34546.1 L-aspartate oxidase [Pontibacillus yanchengensis]MYL54414.1 L-aspartate oxidase [Pontibacillus yanchengensis]
MQKTDVVIIGSGVASLQLASKLSKHLNVIVLTKSSLQHGNSSLAQGGIAAAIGLDDDPYQHYLDTLEAGRYSNNHQAVQSLTEEAPEIIEELLQQGCEFDLTEDGTPSLGMEGSHRHHRIVHGGGDQTGKRIVDYLIQQTGENITVIEDFLVYELLVDPSSNTCYGVKGKDSAGDIQTFIANHIVLSTGGCGQVYSLTSNASTVTGDGIALAYKAGATVMDMEFVQFHPTLLYLNGETKGLVSEAVRGEGAKLVNEHGEQIMKGVHPLQDLGPRHVVSQTIYDYIQQGHTVYLDIRSIPNFQKRFPGITSLCESNGVVIADGFIPVAPGCHFLMGGIQTNEMGKTSIHGLYAIGETACTGIHGANRLASNSLLEGLVYGKRLANYINQQPRRFYHSIPTHLIQAQPSEHTFSPLPSITQIQEKMMRHTGIVREKNSLNEQIKWLESYSLKHLLQANYNALSKEQITTIFMLITSWLVTSSSLTREESRGGHFRNDFPVEKKEWETKHIFHQKQYKKGDIYEQNQATAIN